MARKKVKNYTVIQHCWEEAWRQTDLFLEDYNSSDDDMCAVDERGFDEDGNIKGVWKKKPLERFGLPVRMDVMDKVTLHRRYLHLQAKGIRKERRTIQHERNSTGRKAKPAKMKLDPGVLWFVCTQGCRGRPFRVGIPNSDVLEDAPRHWCCDNCEWNYIILRCSALPAYQRRSVFLAVDS